MSKSSEPNILLDSDVVRHFINAGKIHQLSSIFPKRFVMLDKVKNELCRSKSIESTVNNFLTMTKVPVVPFPKEIEIIKEYALLTKQFGDGESACMAVAKYKKQFIASSNLKDISAFCKANAITYLTTMDILLHAFNTKLFSKKECDEFITNVKEKGSILPCNTLDEFVKMKKKQ
jgi:predicted nucleic acid-binding protein